MPIECGTPRGEKLYWTFVTVLFVGFAAYFFYDWKWGYRAQNIAAARQYFSSNPALADGLGESPTEQTYQRLLTEMTRPIANARPDVKQQLDAALRRPDYTPFFEVLSKLPPIRADRIREELGKPTEVRSRTTGETEERYASVYGVIEVISRNDLVTDPARSLTWKKWKHTRAEIEAQLYWGLVPLVLSIWPLIRLYRALTLRTRLDEKGLVHGGLEVPFERMKALRDYNRKGWVDLYYTPDGDAGGADRMLRLDKLKIERFPEVVAEIARRKGFENPLEHPEEAESEENSQA